MRPFSSSGGCPHVACADALRAGHDASPSATLDASIPLKQAVWARSRLSRVFLAEVTWSAIACGCLYATRTLLSPNEAVGSLLVIRVSKRLRLWVIAEARVRIVAEICPFRPRAEHARPRNFAKSARIRANEAVRSWNARARRVSVRPEQLRVDVAHVLDAPSWIRALLLLHACGCRLDRWWGWRWRGRIDHVHDVACSVVFVVVDCLVSAE